MSPVEICVTRWDTENITTDSTVETPFRSVVLCRFIRTDIIYINWQGIMDTEACWPITVR